MALLSDHRRVLFAVTVNNLITERYELEAQHDNANPDQDFKRERRESDLKDPLLYQDLLCGKTMRRKGPIKNNIVETLHEDLVLRDFLKYLDQLFTDKKHEDDVDTKNELQKRVKIALDLLKELMKQVCMLDTHEAFNQKIQLIKGTLKGKRGQRISNYFEK
jgi:hypothetical protein